MAMSDVFMEHLVKKQRTTADKVKIGLIIGGGVLVTLVLLAVLFVVAAAFAGVDGGNAMVRQMVFTVGLLLIAGAWYGAYLLINGRSIEYEYIVTNNELDIDKVLAKKGRKHLVTVDIQEAQLMARTDDEKYNAVYKNPPEGVKVLDYSALSPEYLTYFIDCTVDEKRTIVVFQPPQKMVDALWKYNPRAVKKDV